METSVTGQLKFIIVTGLSGAGRTTISHAFEDLNFFVVDNMPPELIPKFGEICIKSQGRINRVLLVLDIRGGFTFDELFSALEELKKMSIPYEILFLEASNETLIKRFSETRRKHPLGARMILMDAINEERRMLVPIREKASLVINTSKLNAGKLKERVAHYFSEYRKEPVFVVNLISFGFKHGIPTSSDMVLDLRFLPNPFYVKSLKPLTGLDPKVVEYIMRHHISQAFREKLFTFVDFLVPEYEREGKSHLEIALGCTGGKHRSVAFCEMLCTHLKDRNYQVIIKHREIQ